MKVIQLNLWMTDKKRKWFTDMKAADGELKPRRGRMVPIKPSGESAVQMKLDVAKVLRKYMREVESYYVVAVVDKGDGEIAYRTVTKKIVVTT